MAIQSEVEPFTSLTAKTLGLYLLAGFVVGMMFAVILLYGLQIDGPGMVQNLISETLGIGFTVFVIDQLNQRRQAKHSLRELQEQLVRDAGSTSNEIAKNAVHQLRKQGWLVGENGLLKGADLAFADLSEALLRKANLRSAYLRRVNLNHADLLSADLSSTDLEGSDLRNADLMQVKLNNSNLVSADLSSTYLVGADLNGAYIGIDSPNHPNPHYTRFSRETTLPDGTHWTPETDWTKFGAIVEPPEG